MSPYWITLFGSILVIAAPLTRGQSEFNVQLVTKKYVERGSTLTLQCDNDVNPETLYKVAWMKDGYKIFEYISERTPPYRNFSIPWAVLDWKHSNEKQVTLRNVDYEAAGVYFCEVYTNTPIFSKASGDEQVHVILPQTGPPKISFSKRQFYIGENLVANCTTSKARPSPHITWLINGKKVDDKHIRTFLPYSSSSASSSSSIGGGGGGKSSHRSKSHPEKSSEVNTFESHYGSGSSSKHKDADDDLSELSNGPGAAMDDEVGSSYPHFRFLANDNLELKEDNGLNYERIVFEDNGYSNHYTKHANKYKRNRSSKNRRHVSETTRNIHKPTVASSQLSVEVSELHADANGRLEITCLATIPAHVGPGEQFADYKTYSVKIDVEQNEVTSVVPQPAKFGNVSSSSSRATYTFANSICTLIATVTCVIALQML